jgi:chemotaxis protein CheD
MNEYFINPGELIFSKTPVVIKTVLGSCVAVVIYDKVKKFGGLVHYLLPVSPDKTVSTKYGDVGVPTLINKFYNAGSVKTDLEVSILGGSFIIFDRSEIFFIGDKNIDIAQQIVKQNGLRIKVMNVGGEKGRKVAFDTASNQLAVRTLDSMQIDDLYGMTGKLNE